MKKFTWSQLSWVIVVALIAVGIYFRVVNKQASPELHEKVKNIVARQPELQSLYDYAMADDMLSLSEARQILKAAKTLRDAEEVLK